MKKEKGKKGDYTTPRLGGKVASSPRGDGQKKDERKRTASIFSSTRGKKEKKVTILRGRSASHVYERRPVLIRERRKIKDQDGLTMEPSRTEKGGGRGPTYCTGEFPLFCRPGGA